VPLRERFRFSPEHLLRAVKQNIGNPHEQTTDLSNDPYGTRERDVRPEVKLRTVISIADRTHSVTAFEEATSYTKAVIKHWSAHAADYAASVHVLSMLDHAEWHRISGSDMHRQLKCALLIELADRAGSGDLSAIVGYVEGKNASWSEDDQKALVQSFERYLEKEFSQELADGTTVSELEELSGALDRIAGCCDRDIGDYLAEITEAIAEIERAADDDGQDPRDWSRTDLSMSAQSQEEEVRRLFDGLRDS
jgi:hypothetical protein